MSNHKPLINLSRRLGLFYFFLATDVEALAALLYLFSIPRDPKNSLIAGYSLPRLMVMAGMLAIFLAMAALALLAFRNPQRAWSFLDPILVSRKKKNLAALISAILFLAGWLFIVTPSYQFANYGAYADRLRPVAVWLALFSLQAGIGLMIMGRVPGQKAQQDQKSQLIRWGLTLGILLLVWGLIVITRLGIKPDPLYWNQPGIPLLAGQILLAWVIGVILILAGTGQRLPGLLAKFKATRLDLIIFIAIWLITAFLWTHVPFPGSFFAPGPYPPNQQLYLFPTQPNMIQMPSMPFLALG